MVTSLTTFWHLPLEGLRVTCDMTTEDQIELDFFLFDFITPNRILSCLLSQLDFVHALDTQKAV